MYNRVAIAGYVLDAEDSSPMMYANIYVKHTRKGTITDPMGYFFLVANIGDTIIFSSLGYEKLSVIASDSLGDINRPAIVKMQRTVYELSPVNIIALKRYQQFKYEIINMDPPTEEIINARKNFPLKPPDIDYYSRYGGPDHGFVLSPISALYDMFSKEGKERRKLEELEASYELNFQISEKLNPQMVSRITGLNLTDAENFIEWMNLPNSFIINANEYQLIEVIIARYSHYKTTKR